MRRVVQGLNRGSRACGVLWRESSAEKDESMVSFDLVLPSQIMICWERRIGTVEGRRGRLGIPDSLFLEHFNEGGNVDLTRWECVGDGCDTV